MVEVATRAHSFAASTSPASTASLVLRVHVRTRDRHAAFATRLRSLCLMRLRAPGLFAICKGATATRRCCGTGAKAEVALMMARAIKPRAIAASASFILGWRRRSRSSVLTQLGGYIELTYATA